MCGITGILSLNSRTVSPTLLRRMTDALAHRGPDGEGFWQEDVIGLGHRRLAILDLSEAGHQPMLSADHRWVLTYNGEVYNYHQLRIELEAEGVWFRSKTDSEVVLYALARWGTKALLRFNGMFSLALWDRQEKTLLIARDRYGIKPLYYMHANNLFAFGSEQRAISTLPAFTKRLNKAGLVEYLTFQNFFTDQTLLEGIKLFPPGHFAVISPENSRLSLEQYWNYQFVEPCGVVASESEYLEEYKRLFAQAVSSQLISDVELGTYLSGGIDSGSITAFAAKDFVGLKSFTCGFDLSSASGMELAFDERGRAEEMSALFQTEHYEMVLKAGDMERSLEKVAWHLEEPRVGQSYPNYYIAQLASKFVKCVLAGTGGDELFAGYPWRYFTSNNEIGFDGYVEQYYYYWQRLVDNCDLIRLISPMASDADDVCTMDIFKSVLSTHCIEPTRPEDYINQSLYLEAKTFLHSLFIVEDKLSMAHGLETRLPFMDNDLVDFAMRCPVRLKLKNLSPLIMVDENQPGSKRSTYFEKTHDGKQIMRKAMQSYLPLSISQAPKQGFSSPDASWFKGRSIDFVRLKLLNPKSSLYSYLDYNTTHELVSQHLSGRANRRLLIWSLLNLQTWIDLNLA